MGKLPLGPVKGYVAIWPENVDGYIGETANLVHPDREGHRGYLGIW
jgi:hypothetical protein